MQPVQPSGDKTGIADSANIQAAIDRSAYDSATRRALRLLDQHRAWLEGTTTVEGAPELFIGGFDVYGWMGQAAAIMLELIRYGAPGTDVTE